MLAQLLGLNGSWQVKEPWFSLPFLLDDPRLPGHNAGPAGVHEADLSRQSLGFGESYEFTDPAAGAKNRMDSQVPAEPQLGSWNPGRDSPLPIDCREGVGTSSCAIDERSERCVYSFSLVHKHRTVMALPSCLKPSCPSRVSRGSKVRSVRFSFEVAFWFPASEQVSLQGPSPSSCYDTDVSGQAFVNSSFLPAPSGLHAACIPEPSKAPACSAQSPFVAPAPEGCIPGAVERCSLPFLPGLAYCSYPRPSACWSSTPAVSPRSCEAEPANSHRTFVLPFILQLLLFVELSTTCMHQVSILLQLPCQTGLSTVFPHSLVLAVQLYPQLLPCVESSTIRRLQQPLVQHLLGPLQCHRSHKQRCLLVKLPCGQCRHFPVFRLLLLPS